MAAGRLVGTPVPRLEDARLLLGQARFVADLEAPRMLHMAVVRSPVAHATIHHVGVEAARRAPGVRLVLTGQEVATYGRLPSIDLAGPGKAATQRMLPTDRVRFAGEAVAVVIADDPWLAAQAARLVTLDVTELPPVLDAERAAEAQAGVLYPDLGSNVIHTCRQQGHSVLP